MQSRTKTKLLYQDIIGIFNYHFPEIKVMNIDELKDGCFNSSYLVSLDNNKEFVLKVAPNNKQTLLRYEKDLMVSEVNFHTVVQHHLRIPVPEIILFDFTGNLIPQNYFIMKKLFGKPLNSFEKIPEIKREIIYKQLAKYLAYMHNIKGEFFGYEALSPHFIGKEYFDSFKRMFKLLISDAKKIGQILPVEEDDLLTVLEKYKDIFNSITEPCFVHFDLWDGNIFVSNFETTPEIEGLIDFERGFFGDPAADFSQAFGYIDYETDKYFLETYNLYAKTPFILDDNSLLRIKLFRLYLFCIMIVESYYRDVDGSYEDQLTWARDEFVKLYNSLKD